ncbi:MAG: hypothetical protein ACRD1F_04830 [Terriglobales bacterium]
MKLLFPLLYWVGLIVALIGVGLRFWMGSLQWGLGLAVLGVLLLLGARVAQTLYHHLRRPIRDPGSRGRR